MQSIANLVYLYVN